MTQAEVGLSFFLPAEQASFDGVVWFVLVGAVMFVIGLGLGAFVGFQYLAAGRETAIRQSARKEMEKEIRADRTRFRKVFEEISHMTSTLIYNRVLVMAQEIGASDVLAPREMADKIVSAAFLFYQDSGRTQLRVGPARRFTSVDQRSTLPGEKGVLAQAINSGEPVLTRDLPSDPELGERFASLSGCRSAYCLPLRSGLNVYGALLFAHPEAEFFGAPQRDILDVLAQQARVALQNASLYNDLEQEKERFLQAEEEARKKLARDLHDGPTQSVSAIVMRVNFTRRLIEKNVPAAAAELVKIEDMARRTTKEIRHMLFTLRPLVLETQGLQAALQAMADKMHETFEQNVLIEVEAKVLDELDLGKQTVIFYIAEEAANNARKHARAPHIWIRLNSFGAGLAVLEIKDDGIGFNPKAVDASYERRGSLGMVNMRERAELVSGQLSITSAEGQGTAVKVLIPLTEEAEDQLRGGGIHAS